MFVILIYDAADGRCQKLHKICKRYLTWVQFSVFEGELTNAQLKKLVVLLRQVMVEEADSLIVYEFRTKHYFSRTVYGLEKGNPDEIFF